MEDVGETGKETVLLSMIQVFPKKPLGQFGQVENGGETVTNSHGPMIQVFPRNPSDGVTLG